MLPIAQGLRSQETRARSTGDDLGKTFPSLPRRKLRQGSAQIQGTQACPPPNLGGNLWEGAGFRRPEADSVKGEFQVEDETTLSAVPMGDGEAQYLDDLG